MELVHISHDLLLLGFSNVQKGHTFGFFAPEELSAIASGWGAPHMPHIYNKNKT